MGLRTKINASIGTSTDIVDLKAEIRKAHGKTRSMPSSTAWYRS